MSYGVSQALQSAVYNALLVDAVLGGIVGSSIYDAIPSGARPELYVSLGAEDVSARQDSSGSVTVHRFLISVVGQGDGFSLLKSAAGAVSDSLNNASLSLSRGHLISLNFQKAQARKTSQNRERRIDLWFRAIVEDS